MPTSKPGWSIDPCPVQESILIAVLATLVAVSAFVQYRIGHKNYLTAHSGPFRFGLAWSKRTHFGGYFSFGCDF